MFFKSKTLFGLFLGFIGMGISAQDLNFKGVLPMWNQTGNISPKFNYNFTIYPTFDVLDESVQGMSYPKTTLQLYVQPSLIYLLNAQWQMAVSYTYQRNNPINERYSNEHRLWQQSSFMHNIEKGQISHRVRMEERFIQNRADDSYPLSTRLRYQMACMVPLEGPSLEAKEYYFNSYNEFFFSLSGQRNALYSDNWTYLGIGYHLGDLGRIELGYLLQNAIRNPAGDHRYLHLLQMAWFSNFRFW